MSRGKDEPFCTPTEGGTIALATAAASDENKLTDQRSDPERQVCISPGITILTDSTKRVKLSSTSQEEDSQECPGMSQQKTKSATGPSVTTEEKRKKRFFGIQFPKSKKEKCTPHEKMAPTCTGTSHKGKPALIDKEDNKLCTKKAQRDSSIVSQPHQDNSHISRGKLSTSVISSPMESSVDFEEDMYRDAEELEREKVLLECGTGSSDFLENKLSVEPEVDIMDYCQEEWRGNTAQAKCIRKGYEAVSHRFISIRRVRGDNYCAVRATLFQALSQATQLPDCLQREDMVMLPQKLIIKYDWLGQWQLRQKWTNNVENLVDEIKECLMLLKRKWKTMAEMKTHTERQAACDELFRSEDDEYKLYEAVKFLMLSTAIKLYEDNEKGKEVPVFAWLLFARDTSSNPSQLMENHLNQLGHTGGLEQIQLSESSKAKLGKSYILD
ncbi:ubiquitin thioesterase otulin isoform X2 [Sceloporus undulatus]|uniref:ubiquitin thioesterase otulin isoform X2 n=1 Tax=Sceloporus undulatus TaxID=8520 RepID=UPI001C4C41DA|nr:ubiquitin thioesterase otulin isoform X2 [Sceloporus undulatus]